MERTDSSIERLERAIERMEQEGARDREESARFRAEMARDRDEMKQQADRERREMNKRWGELANKMGTVVEDIVAPSIQRLAREVFDCGEPQYFGTRVSLWCGIYAIDGRRGHAGAHGGRFYPVTRTMTSRRSSHRHAQA